MTELVIPDFVPTSFPKSGTEVPTPFPFPLGNGGRGNEVEVGTKSESGTKSRERSHDLVHRHSEQISSNRSAK